MHILGYINIQLLHIFGCSNAQLLHIFPIPFFNSLNHLLLSSSLLPLSLIKRLPSSHYNAFVFHFSAILSAIKEKGDVREEYKDEKREKEKEKEEKEQKENRSSYT